MKKHFGYWIIAFVALLLNGCEEVLDIGEFDNQRYITVNALMCADSSLSVNITYSRFFLDNSPFEGINNAQVTMMVNGVQTGCSSINGGNYFFNHTLAERDSIALRISGLPNDSVVTATAIVPAFPNMTMPTYSLDTTQPFTMGDICFTLSDPGNERNYYQIFILERDSGSRWNSFEERWDTIDTVVHSYFTCLVQEISSPEVNVSEGFFNYFNNLLFSDSLIDGTNCEIKVSLTLPRDTAEHPLLRQYRLVVESLSRDAYLYMRDVSLAQGIAQYFAEPSAVYGNLTGGALGIVAGMARREYDFEFTETVYSNNIQSNGTEKHIYRRNAM